MCITFTESPALRAALHLWLAFVTVASLGMRALLAAAPARYRSVRTAHALTQRILRAAFMAVWHGTMTDASWAAFWGRKGSAGPVAQLLETFGLVPLFWVGRRELMGGPCGCTWGLLDQAREGLREAAAGHASVPSPVL
jgi:hypothetical protein